MKIIRIPHFVCNVAASFPSPAEDFIEDHLDLNDYLIRHPSATFMARAHGDSMIHRGIFNGDTLIVDRHIEAKHGDVVIAALDGDLTCKTLDIHNQQLLPANPEMQAISIGDEADLIIEGVVVHSIRHHVRAR